MPKAAAEATAKEPKPLTKAKQDAVKAYLKAHGHKASDVDAKDWKDDKAMKRSLLELHGVTPAEYRQAGGTLD